MTPEAARLYVRFVPGIVADLVAVLNTRPEPSVKTDLMASVRTLQALMLEANATLDEGPRKIATGGA